jgi:hypothetical protein
VCYPHYLTFANMVYQGELTWDDPADLGYVHRPSFQPMSRIEQLEQELEEPIR